MKKIFLSLSLGIALVLPLALHAQTTNTNESVGVTGTKVDLSQVGNACSDFTNSSDCAGELVCIKGSGGKGACQVPTIQTSDAVTGTVPDVTDGLPQSTTNTNSGFVPLAPIPNLTQNAVADSTGLANFLNNLYKYLIGLAAALAVIEITWGGIEWATAADNAGRVSGARTRITQALLGLVLILLPSLVFYIINPSILNLSLNLPSLNTQSVGGPGGGSQTDANNKPTGNGSGSVAASNGSAGRAIWSGTYMGLYQFTSSKDAQAYKCPQSGATPLLLDTGVLDKNNQPVGVDVICVAASKNMDEIYTPADASLLGGSDLAYKGLGQYAEPYARYYGECKTLEGKITDEKLSNLNATWNNGFQDGDRPSGDCKSSDFPTEKHTSGQYQCSYGAPVSCNVRR